MTMPGSKMRFALLGALMSVSLSACVGGGAPPPKDQFYRLSANPVSSLAAPVLDGPLEVARFYADGVVHERAIAYDGGEGNLTQYSYHYWTEAPPRLIQEVLTEFLREANVAPMVVTPEHRTLADYVLNGKIRRFEVLEPSNRAVFKVELSLLDPRKGDLMFLKTYDADVQARGEGAALAAQSMSQAVSDVFAEFVKDLKGLGR